MANSKSSRKWRCIDVNVYTDRDESEGNKHTLMEAEAAHLIVKVLNKKGVQPGEVLFPPLRTKLKDGQFRFTMLVFGSDEQFQSFGTLMCKV